MTIHGSKSEFKRSRYHKNRVNASIDAPLTFQSHNFWSDRCIFEFHPFLETENQDLSNGVKINPIRGLLTPAVLEEPPTPGL